MEIIHHLKFQNLYMSSLGVNKEGVNLNNYIGNHSEEFKKILNKYIV